MYNCSTFEMANGLFDLLRAAFTMQVKLHHDGHRPLLLLSSAVSLLLSAFCRRCLFLSIILKKGNKKLSKTANSSKTIAGN